MPDDTQLDLESVHSITERIEDEGLKDLLRCMAKVIHSQHQRLDALENGLRDAPPEEALEDWYRGRA